MIVPRIVQRYHGRQDKLDFSTEPLLCYYADMHPSFPIDKQGQVWVIGTFEFHELCDC